MIGVDRENDSLFHLLDNLVLPSFISLVISAHSLSVKQVSSDAWHFCLGQLSDCRIKLLSQYDSNILLIPIIDVQFVHWLSNIACLFL
jgi:hypothetical protein